ncbi:hypothetical protein ABK040_008720 [Willaertia magna]
MLAKSLRFSALNKTNRKFIQKVTRNSSSSNNYKYFSTFLTPLLKINKPLIEIKHSSTTLSPGITSPLALEIYALRPTEYKQWTKEQVASLLRTPEGAGLSEDKVKLLSNLNFDGNEIDVIVQDIESKDVFFAVDRMKENFPSLSDSICMVVVT